MKSFHPLIVVFVIIGISLTTVAAFLYSFEKTSKKYASYVHPKTGYCFRYPSSWRQSAYTEGSLVIPFFLDATAISEGITSHKGLSNLKQGSYVEIVGETIPEAQKNLPIFAPEGAFENAIDKEPITVKSKRDILIDGNKGILAEVDPKPSNENESSVWRYQLYAYVRDGQTMYVFFGFFGSQQSRSKHEREVLRLLQSFRFPEHCNSSA